MMLYTQLQVNDQYNVGDYAGSMYSSQKAEYWSKISIAVGSIWATIWIAVPALYAIAVFALFLISTFS